MSYNIKKCIVSRWGDKGRIVEMDYSQLEVIGAAIVSGDQNMKDDILAGIDSHSQSASWLHPEYTYETIRQGYLDGDEYFTKLRKNAKAPRFELQYGAGVSTIAHNNNLDLNTAKGFVEAYYNRYWRLKEFQDELMEYLKNHLEPSPYTSKKGYPLRQAQWQSETGRIYTFLEDDSPDFLVERGQYTSIKPTLVKNYPMQGFATGDIVPHMLGHLGSLGWATDPSCKMISTVHDSILFDIKLDVLHHSVKTIKRVLEATPRSIEEYFGINMDMPMSVDVEVGVNWGEMKAWTE